MDYPVIDGDGVQVPDGGLSGVLVDHGDEGIALSGVVDVGDLAAPAKLVLENLTGAVLVDAVNEQLRTLRHRAAWDSVSPSLEKWPRNLPRVAQRRTGENEEETAERKWEEEKRGRGTVEVGMIRGLGVSLIKMLVHFFLLSKKHMPSFFYSF